MSRMKALFKEIRQNPLLWLVVFAMTLYLLPPREQQLGEGVETIQQQSK